jgi:superfamily I DNA/RNA helicase
MSSQQPKKICPNCGKVLTLRNGKRGQFYGCSGFPICRFTKNYNPDEAADAEKSAKFVPSKYQQTVFDFIKTGTGNAFVEAVAGSGKTTTIVQALKFTTGRVAFFAFNKSIANELSKKAPFHVQVSTLHSHGFGIINKAFPQKPLVDQYKKDGIAQELLPDVEGKIDNKYARSILVNLAAMCQNTLTDEDDRDAIISLIEHFGVETNGCEELVISSLPEMIKRCAERTSVVDFDDMIWMPVRLNLPTVKYDWMFIDECLPGYMPVLLADGTSLPIKEIVEKKLDVSVLAYDEKSGEQKPCKITNWHTIPNKKSLVRVKVRRDVPVSQSERCRKTNFVICTIDHKVWTTEGWIEAGKLKPGMKVQVETSATKVQKGKIASVGRSVVAREVSKRNDAGVTDISQVKSIISPAVRGGNGRALTVPQQLLLDALGDGWVAEYAAKTKPAGGKAAGYPWAYKIDVANVEHMIAIEVDGSSHNKVKDAKKDNCLEQLGWTVYRFENMYTVNNLDDIVAIINEDIDCPVMATIESVDPTITKEYFVYDITVEDCHNFYANGILVHNCQDLNKAQMVLVEQSLAENGRIVAVGDKNQSLYGFRGADVDAVDNFITRFDACSLPLSISYRCPVSHVKLARQLVPQMEYANTAIEGEIVYAMPQHKATDEMKSGDMVLCRVNAPLVKICYSLIRSGKKAVIRGRDIGKGLMQLIDKMKAANIPELCQKLETYRRNELEKLYKKQSRETQITALNDRVDTLLELTDGIYDMSQLRARIETIFSDKEEGIVCSSVHRSKGLEASSIYIIKPELMPFPKAKKDWEVKQEKCCMVVAITRSKNRLVFIDGYPTLTINDVEQQVADLLETEYVLTQDDTF